MKKRIEILDFVSMAASIAASIPLCVVLWWAFNFAMFVESGDGAQAWISFNSWLASLFV